MVQEEFLQYIWLHKLFNQTNLTSECGQKIEIIHPGDYNTHAGPDFFNAKIKIGGTLWAGNVEVHSVASEWESHNHHNNKAYDNVILHVVDVNDSESSNSIGKVIPVLRLKYSENQLKNYRQLNNSAEWLACASHLNNIHAFEISAWIQRILIERLEHKTEDIVRILEQTKNNWDETFYRMLFRCFGFGVNGLPFELLAQSIPLKILLKYCNNQLLLEALLFGQAGFLSNQFNDEYLNNLKREYDFLKHKHQLLAVDNHLWKFLRLRPSNFPTIRIAQLASLLNKMKGMFGMIINEEDVKKVESQLQVEVSLYWQDHYVMQKQSTKSRKKLGVNSKNLIIINTIIPYLFAYGKMTGDERYTKRSLDWLSRLKAEKNAIIKEWETHEIQVINAGDSQALIYLSNNYCKAKKCLRCRIGHKVLAINN